LPGAGDGGDAAAACPEAIPAERWAGRWNAYPGKTNTKKARKQQKTKEKQSKETKPHGHKIPAKQNNKTQLNTLGARKDIETKNKA